MNIIPRNAEVTMSSVELVEYINSERTPGAAELRHDQFMAKVPKVLGEAAPKFLGTDHYLNGTGAKLTRNVYRFPKREACLMAMSYSYDLQAKVYDRMTALEQQAVPQVQNPVLAALMAQMVELDRVEQEQQKLALEQKVITQRIDAIEDRVATQDTMFYTVIGYAKRVGAFVDNARASVLGRKATKLSKEREYPLGEATDPRYGTVHTYHVDILQEVFA